MTLNIAGWPAPVRSGGALLLGLLVSLGIFAAAPLLQDPPTGGPAARAKIVDLYLPRQAEPPPPETKSQPPKPPPAATAKPLASLRPLMQAVCLKTPTLDLALDPRITMGPAIAPPGPGRYQMGEVDNLPMVVARIPPIYPYSAKRRGIEGKVDLMFLVDTQGRVSHLRVTGSRPSGVFDDSVRRAVSRWRFRPGVKDGRPVETWVTTTVRFKLER